MRQGQQNRRGRGRNRKSGGQSPLTRNLESNGPDVKIRGTAAHVAEKYMALARDAHTSGDPVLAENYLQHAEHYNRIILAFRDQQIGDMPNGGQRFRGPNDVAEYGDDYDDDGDDMGPGDSQPAVRMPHDPQPPMQQPVAQRPYDQAPRGDDYRPQNDHDQNYGRNRFRPRHQGQRPHQDQQRHDQQRPQRHDGQRHDGGQRPYQGHRPDRPERHDRPERFDSPEPFERPERHERVERVERHAELPSAPEMPPMVTVAPPPMVEAAAVAAPVAPVPTPRVDREPAAPRVRRDRFAQQPEHEQPEFLRRPVRRPRRDAAAAPNGDGAADAPPAAPVTPVDKA